MATGTNSANQNMRVSVETLNIGGTDVTATASQLNAGFAAATTISALTTGSTIATVENRVQAILTLLAARGFAIVA